MKRIAPGGALVTIAVLLVGAIAQTLSPTILFEGTVATPGKNGATQAVYISVQAWVITGQEQEIRLRDFYVAHLISGQISTRIDGRTTTHSPGDYWPVRAGAAMRVKVVGEVAMLETTVVGKQ
jgi:hypothetical protein